MIFSHRHYQELMRIIIHKTLLKNCLGMFRVVQIQEIKGKLEADRDDYL